MHKIYVKFIVQSMQFWFILLAPVVRRTLLRNSVRLCVRPFVCLSICHIGDSLLDCSTYRNILCTTR